MGGIVAQYMALADPGRLDSLVLMDTSHGPVAGLEPDLVQAAIAVVRTRGVDALADLLAGRESPIETEAHRRLLADRPGYAAFEDKKFRDRGCAVRRHGRRLRRDADRLDRLATLPLALPVLVMVGAEDAPFLDPSEQMAATIPDAALAVIPDAGHSPQFETPRPGGRHCRASSTSSRPARHGRSPAWCPGDAAVSPPPDDR